jgi:hypothetical protein
MNHRSLTSVVDSSEFREIPSHLCLHTHLLRIIPSETLHAIEHGRRRSVRHKQPATAIEIHAPCIRREITMAHNIRTGYYLVAYILSEALRLRASVWLSSSPLQHTSRSWRFANAHLHHLSRHNFRSVGISATGKSVYPFSVRSPGK